MKKQQKDKYKQRADDLEALYAQALIELGTIVDNLLNEDQRMVELISNKDVHSALRVGISEEKVGKFMSEHEMRMQFAKMAVNRFMAKHSNHLKRSTGCTPNGSKLKLVSPTDSEQSD